MKRFLIFYCLVFLLWYALFIANQKESYIMVPRVKNKTDVCALFPQTAVAVKQRLADELTSLSEKLDVIANINDSARTFENTVLAFDRAIAGCERFAGMAETLHLLSPDPAVREAAQKALVEIERFFVDHITLNEKIYQAFKSYSEQGADREQCSDEQRYYIEEALRDFERAGLHLPEEQREQLKEYQKELAQLGQDFLTNVNNDAQTFAATADELAGIDSAIIAQLPCDEQGVYTLGADYPTYFAVMDTCSVPETRKKMYKMFFGRAYPKNYQILKRIIELCHAVAQLIGFKNYAHLDFDNKMMKTPETAYAFLDALNNRLQNKLARELALLKDNLPEGIELNELDQFLPWDLRYVEAHYKKTALAVDEAALREFFPVQQVIDQTLAIYSDFLNLAFKREPISGLWHEDVEYIGIYDEHGKLLGHLILDLYPRANKYGHACQITICKPVVEKGARLESVSVLVANFQKPSPDHPSLLRFEDVKTFFHEFGHAMHALCGATQMFGFAGTSVKRDFVEMPSQMFEEWIYEPEVLKKMSRHYKTNEALDDVMIAKLREAKIATSALWTARQLGFAYEALDDFASGDCDPHAIRSAVQKRVCSYVAFGEDDHLESSFGHLIGYGACYCGYLWAKVFSVDLFEHIKEHGLFDQAIGLKVKNELLGKGGSVDPNKILIDFLAREPQFEALCQNMGF